MGEVIEWAPNEQAEWDQLKRRTASRKFQEQEAAAAPLPGEPEPVDPVAELLDVLTMARDYVAPIAPYVPQIYTDEVLRELAAKTVPVLDKHGWSLSGVSDFLGPELRLLAFLAPLLYVTYLAAKAHKAAQLAERTVDMPAPQERTPEAAPVRTLVPVQDTGGQLREMGA